MCLIINSKATQNGLPNASRYPSNAKILGLLKRLVQNRIAPGDTDVVTIERERPIA